MSYQQRFEIRTSGRGTTEITAEVARQVRAAPKTKTWGSLEG